ncbi:acyl-CoA carboxylase subunit epsilon [Nocardioides sp. SR21]|uniref:acyl-CoA carboxylase subunit epsilon n=1 Tax=Nocardioides sp. SR21 TaxID=2919501 RepID=UPI001FAB0FFC|nr:acyl-CoA carboxylase subunit epsilon [Nocardioides sp. SR21]
MSDAENQPSEQGKPFLRVVRGDATPEEVAALVAVLGSLRPAEEAPPRRTAEWSAHHRKVRRTLPHGPGGWRSSGLPR